MRLTANAAILLTALLAAPALPAADAKGNYAVFGAGRISCNTFLGDREQAALDRYKAYTLGYLTAWNGVSPDTYSISGDRPLDAILGLVADYCGEHRIESFERALRLTVEGFTESRTRAGPGAAKGWGR